MSEHLPIPESWRWSTMSIGCEKIQDGTHFSPHQSKQLESGPYPYVTAKNVRPSGLDLANITFLAEEDHRQIYERCDPRTGDVLLVKDGVNAGDAAINTFDGEISLLSSVSMLRPRPELLTSGFLRYYLLSPQGYRSLTGQLSGTAIKRIILQKIREMPVPVAPIQEQGRIVTKLDELLSDLDAGVAALERAKANLKRYRAAVLKAAVEGKLTETWRAEHPSTEPASTLLERILAERRQKWEADQLTKYTAAEKEPPKNWKDKYTEPSPPDTTGLPELPRGWCWVSVEQLTVRSEYGTSVKCDYDSSGPPVLRIPNIAAGEIDLADMKFSTQPLDFAADDSLRLGDMLMCRTNGSISLIGKAALVRSDLPQPHSFASYLLRFRFGLTAILPQWVHAFVSSIPGRRFIEANAASSAGQHNISLSLIHRMPIPLAPLSEQGQALSEVEERLSLTTSAEKQLDADLLRAARLRQSVLTQAFDGKLVPQDPTDEPASVLMERLRAKQDVHEGNGKPATSAHPRGRRSTTKQKPGRADT